MVEVWRIESGDGYRAEWVDRKPPFIRVTGPGLTAPMEFVSNGEDALDQFHNAIDRARKAVRA
jgi:hypothetical protein